MLHEGEEGFFCKTEGGYYRKVMKAGRHYVFQMKEQWGGQGAEKGDKRRLEVEVSNPGGMHTHENK